VRSFAPSEMCTRDPVLPNAIHRLREKRQLVWLHGTGDGKSTVAFTVTERMTRSASERAGG
jgi:adenylylsulfate kinase-like enzyme